MNIIDRGSLYAGRLLYPTSERNNRLRLARGVMAISSIVLVTAVDVTDTKVEACAYSFDGKGSDIVEVAQSLEFDPNGINKIIEGKCMPHIGK